MALVAVTFMDDEFKSQYPQIYQPQKLTQGTHVWTLRRIGFKHVPLTDRTITDMPSIKPLDSYRQIRSWGELFVGGGDSILLHTGLKYELLKLVVGLNFDPKENVKGMFQTLGPILHKDCFGTFDLVLVDLSETVMSFQVIMDQLDVLKALTLLVKPDGMIFVKSEVYFSQFKNYFHTLLKSIGKLRLSTYPWNMFITNTFFSTCLALFANNVSTSLRSQILVGTIIPSFDHK